MPSYNIKNKTTGEVVVREMKISEMVEMLKSNPDLDVIPGATPQGDAWRMGVTKRNEGFKDVLRDIKRRNPGSTIDV